MADQSIFEFTGLSKGGSKPMSAGDILDRIRSGSGTETQKGLWFEQLFMRVALQEPGFEVAEIWHWKDWPEREKRAKKTRQDTGIDLVAKLKSGDLVAIQCKCHDENTSLPKEEIDAFLGGFSESFWGGRWIVATCKWSSNSEKAIRGKNPEVKQIDFGNYSNTPIAGKLINPPVQHPFPLQRKAIKKVVKGFSNHVRGRLIMACGTGKTFTSLRISEKIVEDSGKILFAAPSIALVSQARREWLRHTTRPISPLVVCSDQYAGGRGENYADIHTNEMECPVTTDSGQIAKFLRSRSKDVKVVFCTYHSLNRVTDAQGERGVGAFDLAIADEAHRTTGVQKIDTPEQFDFQEFHDDEKLLTKRRLYMTATPRIYTAKSKRSMAKKGVEVIDMSDKHVYGEEFYRLSFSKAVEEKMLSDYRLIVLGVNEASVTRGVKNKLESIDFEGRGRMGVREMCRVIGTSLAVNGQAISESGKKIEESGHMPRSIVFANTIARSKWFADAIESSQVKSLTTRRMKKSKKSMKVIATHLDATSTVLKRNENLRKLENAASMRECRILSNVKLFTEGVDVPSLNAVVFFDPRSSQVDVVQAVGRVMRKSEGKSFGYIVVPVVVPDGLDVLSFLEDGGDGFETVAQVVRALRSHDFRLAEDPARFIMVRSAISIPELRGPGKGKKNLDDLRKELPGLVAKNVDDMGIYAKIVANSGIQIVPIINEDWRQYFQAVSEEGPTNIQNRLEVLKRAAALFHDHPRFSEIDYGGRKRIAGFVGEMEMQDGEPEWRAFGNMQGAGFFKQAINQNNRVISDALDLIPFEGVVKRDNFDAFVELFSQAFGNSWVGTATRLLAMKRPDYFVCINKANKRLLSEAAGVPKNFNLDNYWSRLIEPIQESKWWNSPEPSEDIERRVWWGRAAMLDARFYADEDR